MIPAGSVRRARVIVFPTTLLLATGCGGGQRGPVRGVDLPAIPMAGELDERLGDALRAAQGPRDLGVSAAVFMPGYAVWQGVAGHSHAGTPMRPEMLFEVGSVAKNLEATLVLSLVEDGVLGLEDPVSRWLPPLDHVDPAITVRQLLDHTSGVFNVFEHPDFPWLMPGIDYSRRWRLEETISRFVLEPYAPPGSGQHYSSTNYLLLTAIIEEATGGTVPEAMRVRFLDRLELDHTVMTMGSLPPEPFILAHPMVDLDGDGELEDIRHRPRTWIASLTHPLLFTTATDLVTWMRALYCDRVLLPPASLEAMLTFPPAGDVDPGGARYGLGVVDYSGILGVRAIGHAGSSLGYSAAALYLPESGVAVAWMINTGESPPGLGPTIMGAIWRSLATVLAPDPEARSP